MLVERIKVLQRKNERNQRNNDGKGWAGAEMEQRCSFGCWRKPSAPFSMQATLKLTGNINTKEKKGCVKV